jgi:hypothetical protein
MTRAGLAFLAITIASHAAPLDFGRDVLPILSDACFHCHGPDANERKAKLRLDTKEGLFRVEDGIAVVKPGDVGASALVERILTDDEEEIMPPKKAVRQLTKKEIETLKQWVAEGAQWSGHWAYESMKAQPSGGIDHWLDASISRQGIVPAPEASRERLIRRVSFDLTGLPPTIPEIDAFLADKTDAAFERVVDRLLASPRFAERLATEWLDLARFADTHGYQMDRERPMWAYRDWVIKALNANMPFDQFVRWQLAGDLLPGATQEQILATAFNRLHCQNEEGGIVEEEYRIAYVADRVNTFGTAFLGATMECARCHDHKYDPISQRDFYALSAFFQNIEESGQTPYFTRSMPTPTVLLSTPEQDAKLAALRAGIAAAEAAMAKAEELARMEFVAWSDKLPEGPSVLEPAGALGIFPFDTKANGELQNRVPDGKPARLHEAPPLVDGYDGKALGLYGENGVVLPALGDFTRSDSFTFSLWLRMAAVSERAVVFHKSKAPIDAGSRGYELLLEQGRVAFGLHHMWPGNSVKVVTQGPLDAERWHHVAVTYDGSSKARGVRIFIDGVEASTDVAADGLWKDITYGGGEPPLAIGYRFRDAGFKGGSVDDFRVFGRSLAPVEIASLAGRPDFTSAVQSIPELSPGQRKLLEDYYIATSHDGAIEARAALKKARDAERIFVEEIPEAMAMRESSRERKAYILRRGAYDQRAEEVAANTPGILPPFPAHAPRNRLGLAEWLLHPEHPLMARVTVNRFWQMLVGEGIVATSDNFGTQGARPSHPELLDWLATDFVQHGWDAKRLVRQIVTSKMYRRSSAQPDANDPENRALSRFPARRLTAEMIRDGALAAAGLLVEKTGGPSVRPYQPPGLWEEIAMGKPKYVQSKGDDLYRRSLYTFWKRTVPPPAMTTFDAADRSYCTVKRQSTATPLQSLALLNDVQIVEAARFIAQRALTEGGKSTGQRVEFAFRLTTGRTPKPAESAVLTQLYEEQLAIFTADTAAAEKLLSVGEKPASQNIPPAEHAAATVLAKALLNFDESVMRR